MAVPLCGFPHGQRRSAPPVSRAMCGDEVLMRHTRSELWMYTKACNCPRSLHEHEQQSQVQARTADKQYNRRPFFTSCAPPQSPAVSKKVSLELCTSAWSLCALHALGGEEIPILLTFVVWVSRLLSFGFPTLNVKLVSLYNRCHHDLVEVHTFHKIGSFKRKICQEHLEPFLQNTLDLVTRK